MYPSTAARNGRRSRALSPAHAAFGGRIRELRAQRGLSQEQLGYESGIERSYMGGIERGERNPSLAKILRIAGALGVAPSALFIDRP